jgi:UDP:flavonoid glycosyltransferase YjiC (YdhE family)
MKVLFTTVPAFGHFHPVVPLALAALASGDEVLVATGPRLADWVPACGLPYVRAGHSGSWSTEEREQARQWGELFNFHIFTTLQAPPMSRDLAMICRNWRPDLIVHEETEYAAPLVAKSLGIPCVTQSYPAPARPKEERAVMEGLLEPLWAETVGERPRLWGDMYLDACPPPFQTDEVRSIPNVQPVRPLAFDGPPSSAPESLNELGRPAAYLTFGTAPVFSRVAVIQQAIDAVAGTLKGVVVTTGPNPTEKFALPPGVVAEQYLRQSLVLPSVDVVVSHGGAGTTLGAVEHGLPHVVLPQQTMSQLRNAQRVHILGLGVHLAQGAPSGLQSYKCSTTRATPGE